MSGGRQRVVTTTAPTGWKWRAPLRSFKRWLLWRNLPKRLERLYQNTRAERSVDLTDGKVVIFSDHHKGTRDDADDFWVCERAYNAALGYYLEHGYTLIVLGDAEELWENDSAKVLAEYKRTIELEAEFHGDGRYVRIFGNHDLEWSKRQRVAEGLQPRFGAEPLKVLEALKLRIMSGNETKGWIFLLHGHQGTLESDYLRHVSEPVVRHVWRRVQRRIGFASTSPARNYALRAEHESRMADWSRLPRARTLQPVVIAGHTHRPVFGGEIQEKPSGDAAALLEEARKARAQGHIHEAASARVRAEHLLASAEYYDDPEPVEPPSYFNTGCCSFGDGDVTGLEIAGGSIKLVRWTKSEDQAKPDELECEPLGKVLTTVQNVLGRDEKAA